MSTVVLHPDQQRFPAGTSLNAYVPVEPGGGAGPTLETKTVQADGTLTFVSLADGGYRASGAGSSFAFRVESPVSVGSGVSPIVAFTTTTSTSRPAISGPVQWVGPQSTVGSPAELLAGDVVIDTAA